MKIGQEIEWAVWLDGRETPEMIDHWRQTVSDELRRSAAEHDWLIGPVDFIEKLPGTDRVPEVPDHIQGPNVRLLVGECQIVARKPRLVVNSFLGDLDKVDLERLRAITRRAHKARYPQAQALTDELCDQIIERIGPEAAADAVRKGVDSDTVH